MSTVKRMLADGDISAKLQLQWRHGLALPARAHSTASVSLAVIQQTCH